MAYNWSTGLYTPDAVPASNPVTSSGLKAPEPINSRAEEYRSPGENRSPAGGTIPAGIGTSSYDGQIVFFSGFPENGVTTSWADNIRQATGSGSSGARCTFVMLFKDCLFADSFSLIKLYADDQLLISNVAPLRQSAQSIRFYSGTQTTPDPILVAALGASEATAWPGFCYAVFEEFDCSPYGNRVPLIRAVLSGAVTASAATEEQSTLTFGSLTGYSNASFTVDPMRGYHYQIVSNGSSAYVVTIEIATLTEISRVGVFDFTGFGHIYFPVALEGTDYIVCAPVSNTHPTGSKHRPVLLNAQTGQIVDSLAPISAQYEIVPKRAFRISSWGSTKFLVVTELYFVLGAWPDGSHLGVFVADTTAGTLEWIIHPYSSPATGVGTSYASAESVEFGPTVDGVTTIWYTDNHATEEGAVNVAYVTETGFTSASFYVETESGKAPKGVAYDPTRNVLAVYRTDGSWLKLNATTGAVIATVSGAITDFFVNQWSAAKQTSSHYKAFYHNQRAGYILVTRGTELYHDIYEIDLNTFASTLLIDRSDFSFDDVSVYFDQFESWMTESSDTGTGIINRVTLGDQTPDTVDLVDIFTQLATFDDRFVSGDLAFSGFPGTETSGLKLENDTTVDNLENSIADVFDVKIVESDGDRKYFYPQRDGSFAVTVTLAATDLVERGPTTIEKSFGAGEDEFVGCTVEYHDVDASYKKLNQKYNRPLGIYDITRSKKKRTINTALSLTASQAMRLATLAVFRSVLGNETFSFGLVPGKSHVEPADIAQLDFRGFTVYARVKEATFNADYTQEVRAYQYLQYADGTFTGIAPSVPNEIEPSIFARLIYLDLPLLNYAHDLGGTGLVQYALLAGYGSGSVTASLYKSTDGTTFSSQGSVAGITPVLGVVTAISGTPADPFTKDETNTITVLVNTGDIDDLLTITDSEFDAGVNVAAVGQPGRWVLVWFQTVSSSGGVATLSDLMWGVRGSEVWIDDLEAGDLFVLLTAGEYIRFRNDLTSLDDAVLYKPVSQAVPPFAAPTLSHVAAGVAETPYAPINLDAVVDGSDIDLTWDYRSRLATGTNPSNHGEASLSFEIDIIDDDGTTVLRTLTATTNAKTYASADITTDFGGIPAFLKFRVYMMSAVVGRGYMAENTVQLDASGVPIGLLLTLTYA